MLLLDNLMHADLHPGNILLDARRGQDPRIVLLDVGMVARLTRAEADAFIGLLHAMGPRSALEHPVPVTHLGRFPRGCPRTPETRPGTP